MRLLRCMRKSTATTAHFFTRRPLLKSMVIRRRRRNGCAESRTAGTTEKTSLRSCSGRPPSTSWSAMRRDWENASWVIRALVHHSRPIGPRPARPVSRRKARVHCARWKRRVDIRAIPQLRGGVPVPGRGDKQILQDLRRQPEGFGEGKRSIFTESVLRRVATDGPPTCRKSDRGEAPIRERYVALRYEDLLLHPGKELRRLWIFLGVRTVPAALNSRISKEMKSNAG